MAVRTSWGNWMSSKTREDSSAIHYYYDYETTWVAVHAAAAAKKEDVMVLWVTDTLRMLVNESDMDLNVQNNALAAAVHDLHLYYCFPLAHSSDLHWSPVATRTVATRSTHLAAAWSYTIYILWGLEADQPGSEN